MTGGDAMAAGKAGWRLWAAVAVLAVVAVAGVAGWAVWRDASPGAGPDDQADCRLGRGGCMVLYIAPWFIPDTQSGPGIAFTPDGRKVVLAGREFDPGFEPDAGDLYPSPLWPTRWALKLFDVARGADVETVPIGPYRPQLWDWGGALAVGWSGTHAAFVTRDAATEDKAGPGRLRVWRLDGAAGGGDAALPQLSKRSIISFTADDAVIQADGTSWQVATGEKTQAPRGGWVRGWGDGDGTDSPKGDTVAGYETPVWKHPASMVITLTEKATGAVVQRVDTGLSWSEANTDTRFHFDPADQRLAALWSPIRRDQPSILQVWDLVSGRRLVDARLPPTRGATAWSADGRLLAVTVSIEKSGGIALFRMP